MPNVQLEFGILNVVAHPHGAGTYSRLLARAANREINFWGDLNAAIREPREVEEGIFQSEIVIGTEIDLDEPLIDRRSLEEIEADEADVRVSTAHLYNGRVFLYTFVEEGHLLFFQSRNEFGKTLSPNRAHRIFSRLFSQELLGPQSPYVDVTVVPEDDTLEMLLGLDRLERVEIRLQRPNPADVTDGETQEILAELEEQGAKRQDTSLVKAPGVPRIVLNAKNILLARVAQFNGWVSASGATEDGERFVGSTREYPKVVKVVIDAATASVSATARRIARGTRIGGGPPPEGD